MDVQTHQDLAQVIIYPWEAVPSKVTRGEYLRKSRFFLEFAGYVDPKLMHHRRGVNKMVVPLERAEIKRGMERFILESLADPGRTKNQVIRFIQSELNRVDRKEISPATLRMELKPVKLALDMNEVGIAEGSWRKMFRLIPASPRKGKDREYTLEEVRTLLSHASLHLQVAILFMSSSGMRIGAFDYLNVGHVAPVKEGENLLCGRVVVYAGEGDDEYETFISKEAFIAWERYLENRRVSGQTITAESPAIANRGPMGSRCSTGTIRNTLTRLLWKSGLRKERRKRYDTQVDHAFRKFFDNVAKDYVEEAYVEKLIGHNTGVKGHYDRHLPKPALEQYLKAMPFLSIDEGYRNEAVLARKLEEVEKLKDRDVKDMKLELLTLKDEKKELQEKLQKHDRLLDVIMKYPGVAEAMKKHGSLRGQE